MNETSTEREFYEESASELLSGANSEADPWWSDVLEEMASELVSLVKANASIPQPSSPGGRTCRSYPPGPNHRRKHPCEGWPEP
jgi:hypothetical protein